MVEREWESGSRVWAFISSAGGQSRALLSGQVLPPDLILGYRIVFIRWSDCISNLYDDERMVKESY